MYFDNNQVLARNWREHFDANAILSAVTTIIHVFPFHPCNVQFYPGLSPRSDIGCIKKISVSHGNRLYPFFLRPQKNFISDRLSIITKEQKYEWTGYSDNVSTIVSKRKKQKCKKNTPKSEVKADVYNFVTLHHDEPPEIIVGNPISRNPCSYDAVKDVL